MEKKKAVIGTSLPSDLKYQEHFEKSPEPQTLDFSLNLPIRLFITWNSMIPSTFRVSFSSFFECHYPRGTT